MRSILAPTDFSPTADAGIACAFSLVEPGGSVHLLHVIERSGSPNPLYAHYVPGRAPTPEERARQAAELHARLEALVPEPERERGVRVETHVGEGPEPAEVICELAERIGVDAVAIGSHGRKGVSRVLLGSVAERLLREARCGVVVVRPSRG